MAAKNARTSYFCVVFCFFVCANFAIIFYTGFCHSGFGVGPDEASSEGHIYRVVRPKISSGLYSAGANFRALGDSAANFKIRKTKVSTAKLGRISTDAAPTVFKSLNFADFKIAIFKILGARTRGASMSRFRAGFLAYFYHLN